MLKEFKYFWFTEIPWNIPTKVDCWNNTYLPSKFRKSLCNLIPRVSALRVAPGTYEVDHIQFSLK